jgi:hypothetical protein
MVVQGHGKLAEGRRQQIRRTAINHLAHQEFPNRIDTAITLNRSFGQPGIAETRINIEFCCAENRLFDAPAGL